MTTIKNRKACKTSHMKDNQTTGEEPNFKAMTTEELAAYANQRLAEAGLATELAEMAKTELRKRNLQPGMNLLGNVTVIASPTSVFSPELAEKKLSAEEYLQICAFKPVPGLAQELLGRGTSRYKEMCVPGKVKLTIRTSTDADRDGAEDNAF